MNRPASNSIANTIAAVLCVMLVLFPKGGFRVANVPITWGYILIFLTFVLLLPYRLLVVKAYFVRRQIIALLCIVPMALVFFYSVWMFGLIDAGGFISTGTSLIFLPIFFLWFLPPMLPIVDGARLLRCMQFCVLAAALFGILLFFWRPITGSWIQIPYLTVNGGDVGDFAYTKAINRGYFLKLISTYNNGNIYGAATFLLLRLYDLVTPSRWQRWVLRIALLLTLSRTVWAGLIFDLLLTLAGNLLEQRRKFPVLKLQRLAGVTLVLLLTLPVGITSLKLLDTQQSHGFLLDPTLGGRTAQFTQLGSASFFPYFPSSFQFAEVTYLSAVNTFGIVGSFTISLILLSPLLLVLFDRRALHNPIRKAALKGLLTYALISTSDGALNLIPVMAFYWFAYMIYVFGLPGASTVSPARKIETAGFVSTRTVCN